MDSSDEEYDGAQGREDDRGMAFTTEHDFEGGEWIEGEFYARGPAAKRRRPRNSKDEQIYGVFNGSSDGLQSLASKNWRWSSDTQTCRLSERAAGKKMDLR
jgi:hypothetical protein